MAEVRARAGDTLEWLVFRHYGRQSTELMESVLADPANADLPLNDAILPEGRIVVCPPVPEESDAVRQLTRTQNLWD